MRRRLVLLFFVLVVAVSVTAHAGITAACALGFGDSMETMDMGGEGTSSCPDHD